LVVEYHFVLAAVLEAKPHLEPLLASCRHCRILFLTDPRNRGREDLGCPFGCRDMHRRESSSKRATRYNQTAAGKAKKQQYNKNRSESGAKLAPIKEPVVQESEQGGSSEFDAVIVEYVRLTTRLIEDRAVSRDEVIEILQRAVRQHSMGRERRIDYVVRHLNKHPP
jgi:hypothetical protein